jgi:diguanylate cyclase (GGDEF)-like protein
MTACRWGGEEFLLIGPVHGYMDRRIQELEKLRESVQNEDFCYEDLHLRVTITIGAALCLSDEKIHKSITLADAKLYEGKHNGKNKVCF